MNILGEGEEEGSPSRDSAYVTACAPRGVRE
jgi:hypothetical protein